MAVKRQASTPTTMLLLAALLAACGGPPATETLFLPANVYGEQAPEGAEMVDGETFRRLLRSGELRLSTARQLEDLRVDQAALYAEQRSALLARPDLGPAHLRLLEALPSEGAVGDVEVALGDGQIVGLLGPAAQLSLTTEALALAANEENALAAYRLSYDLLPAELRQDLPDPDSLRGAGVDAVKEAIGRIDEALSGLSAQALDGSYAAPDSFPAPAVLGSPATPRPGGGDDETLPCRAPTGWAADFSFPLRNFLSPVKDQGRRGVCWAFAALGAIEARERVVHGTMAIDLSEQFVIYKEKAEYRWDPFRDAASVGRLIRSAEDGGQSLPPESFWTYNPSPNLVAVAPTSPAAGTAAAYSGACNPYGSAAGGSGSCSETSHQSPYVCTVEAGRLYCGWQLLDYHGAGPRAGSAVLLWSSGEAFNLNVLRQHLSNGHVIVANFAVYDGFLAAVGGVVGDMATDCTLSSCGAHFVQIVGFLGNEQLGLPTDQGGGGYFVVQNSWGCSAGDGGFWYLPADYVEQRFNFLEMLDFGPERSEPWALEQRQPDALRPAITVPAQVQQVQVGARTLLTPFIGIDHPTAAAVQVRISHPSLGTIFEGDWTTDPPAFAPDIPYVFPAIGSYELRVQASYLRLTSTALLRLEAVNSPPTVRQSSAGSPRSGEPFRILLRVSDPNESDAGGMCSRAVWALADGDTVAPAGGCAFDLSFGAPGTRSVRVAVTDSHGAASNTSDVSYTILPPLDNPYPRILGADVLARRIGGGELRLCRDEPVPAGATIVLHELGCTALVGDPNKPPRYTAAVEVENPLDEVLSYDWTLRVFPAGGSGDLISLTASPSPVFTLHRPEVSGQLAIVPCEVRLRVNAPEAERSKERVVWTGTCEYIVPLN